MIPGDIKDLVFHRAAEGDWARPYHEPQWLAWIEYEWRVQQKFIDDYPDEYFIRRPLVDHLMITARNIRNSGIVPGLLPWDMPERSA